jgi:hypothetical protein
MAPDMHETARTIGRGRRESTPWLLHNSVLLVVGVFAAVVIGAALLAFYLT